MTTKRTLPWTHYHPETKTLFELGACPKCDAPVQEANSVGLAQSKVPAGLTIWKEQLPDEIAVEESTGRVMCWECCQHATGDEDLTHYLTKPRSTAQLLGKFGSHFLERVHELESIDCGRDKFGRFYYWKRPQRLGRRWRKFIATTLSEGPMQVTE